MVPFLFLDGNEPLLCSFIFKPLILIRSSLILSSLFNQYISVKLRWLIPKGFTSRSESSPGYKKRIANWLSSFYFLMAIRLIRQFYLLTSNPDYIFINPLIIISINNFSVKLPELIPQEFVPRSESSPGYKKGIITTMVPFLFLDGNEPLLCSFIFKPLILIRSSLILSSLFNQYISVKLQN